MNAADIRRETQQLRARIRRLAPKLRASKSHTIPQQRLEELVEASTRRAK